MADSFRDVNSVKNYTLTLKAVSEKLADKNGMVDSTVSSEWSFNMTPKEDVIDPFDKFSDDDYPAISRDTFDKFDRTMGATDTMALLGYVSFLSSSPIVTLATPSLASQEDNSDLDNTIPNGSFFTKGHTASPPTPTSTTTLVMTLSKGVAPPLAPSCAICGSPVVDSVITRSPTLPSSLAVGPSFNSPNKLFTLSDLKHRDPDYI
ncbi:hypothetical protein D6D21_07338 [Aureobasidium pullulans]|uniref:Uncharacterized protein n=1 Tax=Aureobasidium pullulans TaxID=5580 RepID=A0AB74ISK2_AURPU|nr:hypothetical protein D6D21_07338 [Aureobasidium pullulans]